MFHNTIYSVACRPHHLANEWAPNESKASGVKLMFTGELRDLAVVALLRTITRFSSCFVYHSKARDLTD